MDILIQILQLILSLSILVIVHEFGHFAAAKIFKTRVEKFYLFFNPWFSIFKFTYKGTEYGMGWLPLGGYVKIAGMIDESMDKEAMKLPPEPYEFRSKPAWQRLIIMLGGVIMNVVLAFVIYIGMLTFWGDQYLSTEQANRYGLRVDSLAMEMGFQSGDKVLKLDGEYIENFAKIPTNLVLNQVSTVEVLRNESKVNIVLTENNLESLLNHRAPIFSIRMPFVADKFEKNSVAKAAGIIEGDRVIAVNGNDFPYFMDFRDEIVKHKNSEVLITVLRDNDTINISMILGEDGLIGVYPKHPDEFFEYSKKSYTFVQAIPAGFSRTISGIDNYLKQLRLIFSSESAYKGLGGFITIGSIFPKQWHWESFWRLTAFLSIMLAILNVLPIPALDGGHVMFLLYEIIARRKPSDKFMEYAQMVGMLLLFALLIFANGNDIIRHFF